MLNHWTQEHEDIRTLLYLDVSSFTILNVKVICNNVGYCSYSGCSHIMWGSRKADFPNSVRAGEGAGKRKGAGSKDCLGGMLDSE